MKSPSTPLKNEKAPTAAKKKKTKATPPTEKRRYNSVVRQQQTNKTRELIITSGVNLVHEFTTWDWNNLTFRAISERAGISERTVYRYFSTEQALKDAVMQRLVQESGIDLNTLTLSEFATIIKALFRYMQSFAAKSGDVEDPHLSSVDKERRDALLRSVVQATPGWSETQQQTATAALDILWQPATFERLLNSWNLDSAQSLAALSWVVDLIQNAIKDGQYPEMP